MGREGERDGKEGVRIKERGGRGKGKGGESVPLALILHWRGLHFTILPGSPCAVKFYEIWHTRSTH